MGLETASVRFFILFFETSILYWVLMTGLGLKKTTKPFWKGKQFMILQFSLNKYFFVFLRKKINLFLNFARCKIILEFKH